VAFAGDDLGDLAAFDEVERLRARGVPGLLVCSGSQEEQALAARADLVVDGPAGVVAFISHLIGALESRR
jgi:trehalose 6-phosphate phosphatase